MIALPTAVLHDFLAAAHTIARHGLVRCSSGNLSWRLAGDRVLVTATGSWMERLTADDLALCRLSDGAPLDGRRPSGELGFHLGVLRARPEVNAVLHFQSPCATALACRPEGGIEYAVIPEVPYYIGPVARVPYSPPGSAELAQAVTAALRDHDLAQLAHHGQVTAAGDLDRLIQNAVFFELACELILRSGEAATPLTPQAVGELIRLRAGLGGRGV